ncbi:MAG: hypothetical protein IT304_00140 [Dehalococcoidia bacterium]|nr:hypothetical protein [Dehalococcoidia bacterium]
MQLFDNQDGSRLRMDARRRAVAAGVQRPVARSASAETDQHPQIELADALRVAVAWRRFFRQAAGAVHDVEQPAYQRSGY